MNGFLNVLKPPRVSSSRVVQSLKGRVKPDRVGHMGTLDPGAAGVLPVAIGKATRLFDYLLAKRKTYRAYFTFGVTTDTLDSYGKISGGGDVGFSQSRLEAALADLTGELWQVPPAYSAVSVRGRRAYDLARQGREFELPAKKVTVYSFEPVCQYAEDTYVFDITVSGGTYIRSLCRDLAAKLGTVGYMSALIRTRAGSFDIGNAILPEEIQDIERHLIPMREVLRDLPVYRVPEDCYFRLANGVKLESGDLPAGQFVVECRGELFGLGEDGGGFLEIKANLR